MKKNPPSILSLVALLAAAGAAWAHSAADTTYRGRTGQGIAVKLGPQHPYGRVFRYRARMKCTDGSVFTDAYFSDAVHVRRGRFRSRVRSDGGAVITDVTGVVRPARAHGTIRIVERFSEIPDAQGNTPLAADGAIRCDSHVVPWRAAAQ